MERKGNAGRKRSGTTFSPDANTVILGFTGSIGSGCTYTAKGLEKHYQFHYYSLSKILKSLSLQNNLSIDQLQELGDKVRAENRNSFLVEKLFDQIKIDAKRLENKRGIIIDSIRNDDEVKTLKQFPYFYLFSVHADEEIRAKRTVGKGKKFKSQKEFEKADNRDRAEDVPYGQQVKKCNDLADIILNNDKDIPKTAELEKKKYIDEIYNSYISLIEKKKEGLLAPENLPSIEETLMTMAYSESQRSSCLKRKVGAIIASIKTAENKENFPKAIRDQVHIISSGHNEVPLGTIPCVFTEYEKCYRDYLQEEHAKKIHFCPSCGEKIKLSQVVCSKCQKKISSFVKVCPDCKKEIKIEYRCSCNIEIFKEHLLSGGKLLDMCRSLHAEENALLNLSKMGSNNLEDLVLYTTTYPCNLCANKIVASSIKYVIYADPYPMKEAKSILEKGGVKTKKFQGIKSSAFFRLYT